MKKEEDNGILNLTQFEKATEELWNPYTKACKEVNDVYDKKKGLTDLTKLSAVIIGAMAKLKGAESHRMAMEIMVQRKQFAIKDIPQLPPAR